MLNEAAPKMPRFRTRNMSKDKRERVNKVKEGDIFMGIELICKIALTRRTLTMTILIHVRSTLFPREKSNKNKTARTMLIERR